MRHLQDNDKEVEWKVAEAALEIIEEGGGHYEGRQHGGNDRWGGGSDGL